MRALVIGGTGPTGPFIVSGLRRRGYKVTIFHRGTHEIAEIPQEVEHIHGDPHFAETIDAALSGRTFDLAIASYGRVRLLAHALKGRAGRFIALGGFAVYRGWHDPYALTPPGLASPVPEDAPLVASEQEHRFASLIAQTEQHVFEAHPTGTVFRYPYVYGPYQVHPREWLIVRRLIEGRREIIVPHYGLQLSTHGWAGNLAHAVLLAVDRFDAAAGRVYNCGDLEQLTLQQIVRVIADALGRDVETIGVPYEVAGPMQHLVLSPAPNGHQLLDLTRVRTELGYSDVLGAREAIAETARWYAANPPPRGGEIETALGDTFDYDAEDRLIKAHRDGLALLRANALRAQKTAQHTYAHPRAPGQLRDQHGR
ncbi:MAG TPA: NAD-dependent epimerase/dehydratase family protein [Rhizomicrobium sp.]|nr:NAD-dependent epimerase/dehydratase family protein [Rhizomicrobium sp.]